MFDSADAICADCLKRVDAVYAVNPRGPDVSPKASFGLLVRGKDGRTRSSQLIARRDKRRISEREGQSLAAFEDGDIHRLAAFIETLLPIAILNPERAFVRATQPASAVMRGLRGPSF
jgi:cytochrome c553